MISQRNTANKLFASFCDFSRLSSDERDQIIRLAVDWVIRGDVRILFVKRVAGLITHTEANSLGLNPLPLPADLSNPNSHVTAQFDSAWLAGDPSPWSFFMSFQNYRLNKKLGDFIVCATAIWAMRSSERRLFFLKTAEAIRKVEQVRLPESAGSKLPEDFESEAELREFLMVDIEIGGESFDIDPYDSEAVPRRRGPTFTL